MVRATINPEVLEWAVRNTHYTLDSFAQKMRITPERVKSWIDGTKRPTYKQLERIAYDVLKVPVAVFFFPSPPEESIAQSFRTLPDFVVDNFSPEFIKVLRRAAALQVRVEELHEGINPSTQRVFEDITVGQSESATKLSSTVRDYFGITLKWQSCPDTYDLALKNWRDLIQDSGIYVFKEAFRDAHFSHFECKVTKVQPGQGAEQWDCWNVACHTPAARCDGLAPGSRETRRAKDAGYPFSLAMVAGLGELRPSAPTVHQRVEGD